MRTILVLAANPKGTAALEIDREVKEIRAGLERSRDRSEFRLEYRPAVTWEEMRRAIMDLQPQIVHFSGHGEKGKGLIFEGADGRSEAVTKESLKQLFEVFPVECVVLSACYSETEAKAVHEHVPCVVGMNYSVGDTSARQFAVGFYDGVMAGFGFQKAFKLGLSGILNVSDMDTPVLLWRESEVTGEMGTIGDLESPIGRMSVESKFYVERPTAEEDAGREILRSGALIRIKGPREFGKSSLMARMVTQAEAAGAKTVSINFRETDLAALGKLDDFLRYFCDAVTLDLDFDGQLDERRVRALGYKKACGDYFQTVLLPQISGSLVLELDEVDVLLDSHVENAWIADFFSMLRVWHDDKMKAHPVWKKLRLVLVHSRHIDTLPERQSPFNVGEEIQLQEFTQSQVVELARRHGVGEAIAVELLDLVGGHPQLIRRGLYGIARGQVSLEQLRENGATEAGFYGQHLEQIGRRIEQDAELKTVVRMVLAGGESAVTIDHHHKARLRSFGWVVFHGNGVRIACELYRQYFKGLGL